MPPNPPEFPDLVRALNSEGVRYVVIGGMALVLHGGDITTVDSDFAVAADPENKTPLVRALAPFHPRPSHLSGFKDFPWDERSIFGSVVSLVTDVGDVDLLRVVPGVDSFEGLWDRSIVREVFGQEIRIASLEDLSLMKKEANRPRDKVHLLEIEALTRLHQQSE